MVLDTLKNIKGLINGALPDPTAPENKGGFEARTRHSADGDGLPFQKQSINNIGSVKRNIISWLVPEFGIVKMYINPQNIQFSDKKLINQVKTKGGYTLQYWGEELTNIKLNGTTGSSGIEGINALYEIYRAEQLAFDTQGLVLDSEQSIGLADSIANSATNFLDGLGGVGSLAADVFGLNSPSNSLATKNIPSMAQYAFTVEMYYSGAVYRGFFTDMNVTESADNFAFQYSIGFMVTQKRGYRRNYLPYHRHPQGPSDENSPHTFIGQEGRPQIEPIE